MKRIHRTFIFPTSLWAISLIGMYLWGGPTAFVLTVLLTILEVTLSFDNAVVNARVLMHMEKKWRERFITWGMLIAVFGTRFILPILIVAAGVSMSPLVIAELALFDPAAYGHLLEGAHTVIASFGGAFLLMVSLKYFFDDEKDTHWIRLVERHFSSWGRIAAVEIGISLLVLLILASHKPEKMAEILFAGIIGIILFILMQGIAGSFMQKTGRTVAAGSASLFVYLEVLDASFSLDGVVGAFALTDKLPIIAIGLGIGALFVRTLTIYMVEEKTLHTLKYLEHGAHWAIMGLGASMLVGILVHVPEVITALVGIVFIAASYVSSIRERRKEHAHT